MTAKEILAEIRPLGSEGYKRVIMKHGVTEPCLGVKISDLQRIQKRVKKDYQLALDLYDSGIYDAMYLAGLVADDPRMTVRDLQHWAKKAPCRPLAASTVSWVSAGSPHGWGLAHEWIDAKSALVAVAGWGTLGSLVSVRPDSELDLPALRRLLERVKQRIHGEPDMVRLQMNAFVIAVGSYVQPLTQAALQTGEGVGPVTADLGDTACEVPFSPDYIRKVEKRGALGRKRKSAKC